MRLHRLSVTAFGPFAGSEQVDFDQLSADGLFLLHGRTGAGKTSVLDAVCFALYGAVPGARSGGAPDLRSHHAAPQVAPVVELELTAGGRRLRVERTPAWTRPKRRGEGTTTEQARTLLAEWAPDAADAGADGWRPLSSRNDEASQVLTDVLGMGLAQFATVVLLPQGEFATFLRSGVTERRALLQRLFSTDRYERAERWLATERARTAAAHESAAARLAALADRAEQAGAEWAPVPGPSDHDHDDAATGGQGKTQAAATPDDTTVAAPAGPPQVLRRVRALAAATQQAALRTEGARVSAAAHARSAATAEHAHRDAVDRTRRAARVREEQRHLARTAPQVQHQREELAAATAAQAVEGHLRALAGAQEVLEGAERRAADAAAALTAAAGADPLAGKGAGTDAVTGAGTGAEVEVAGLRERAARHRQEQGRLAELVELEADTAQREQQARQVAAEHDRLAQAQTRLRAQLARGAERRTELTARAESAQEAAAATQDAEQALARAQEVLQHATTADRLAARCEAARSAAASAAQHALDARSRWLDARQARWEGVAAELAAQLRSGQACPVCGACEHPAPAHLRTVPETTDDDAPAVPVDPAAAAAAEERAQGAFERAEADARAAQQHLSDLERDAAAARGACGGTTAAEAADLLQQARVRAEAARNALTSLQTTRAELEQVRTAEAADTTALAQASDALARLVERAESLAQGLARDRARLEAAAGQEGLAARSARLAALAGAAEALAGAVEAETAARHAADVAADAARGAATAAGFVDLAAARAALRTAAHRDQLQRAVSAHERAVAAVHAQLAELARSAADDAREAPATTAEASSVDHVDQADKVDEADEADALAAAEGALAEAARQRAAAEDAAEAAVRAAERAATAAAQLERLEAEVARACAALEPLAREAELAGDLARCADGTGGGNTRRMKLSTYVLAARLEQVAAVASERLEVMSDGRYRLTHTDALERRGAGSGLGLRVVDAWTGVERDVATLSGGETFMASLALALGLADVVRSEGGGSPVETLFVDEGFGTLDPESLEEVMGVLEQLRAGGRAVGLVSHVPELRTRVPARLEVLRTATGSRLSTVLA